MTATVHTLPDAQGAGRSPKPASPGSSPGSGATSPETFGSWLTWEDEKESIRSRAELVHAELALLRDRYRQCCEAQEALAEMDLAEGEAA